MTENLGLTSTSTSKEAATPQQEEDDQDIPECLDDIVGILLLGLQDKDTIVRWSAAKGLGRIANRLSSEMAQEIISNVMDMFQQDVLETQDGNQDLSNVSNSTWHGACLALAELARRGLLLPEQLPTVIPWIRKSLTFDQRKGTYSVGSHVRDSACYVS